MLASSGLFMLVFVCYIFLNMFLSMFCFVFPDRLSQRVSSSFYFWTTYFLLINTLILSFQTIRSTLLKAWLYIFGADRPIAWAGEPSPARQDRFFDGQLLPARLHVPDPFECTQQIEMVRPALIRFCPAFEYFTSRLRFV